MPKILLVEDDNNLREIFDMRLQAEGYQTVSAGDGEEALVVAVKEKPDLIIADVMMPKLSGFEMLETLRSSPDVGKVKVIMMTALGQAEDRARGEKLGVVKYLVKSQVTLEDFVRVVREVLPTRARKQFLAHLPIRQANQKITINKKARILCHQQRITKYQLMTRQLQLLIRMFLGLTQSASQQLTVAQEEALKLHPRKKRQYWGKLITSFPVHRQIVAQLQQATPLLLHQTFL
jgi:DNA-binding response OmpR family regulator